MKTKFLMTLLTFSFMWVGCNKDDSGDSQSTNLTSAEETIQIAQTGAWRISSYIDDGNNETSDYGGYEFTFNSDGTLVASNGTETLNGTWSVDDDDSNSSSDDDGNSVDDDDFNIFFNVSESHDFDDLNDDWDVISISANKMELIDVSGGNGGTDLLTFERI